MRRALREVALLCQNLHPTRHRLLDRCFVAADEELHREILDDVFRAIDQLLRLFFGEDLLQLTEFAIDDLESAQLADVPRQRDVLVMVVDATFLRQCVEIRERLTEHFEAFRLASPNRGPPREHDRSVHTTSFADGYEGRTRTMKRQ